MNLRQYINMNHGEAGRLALLFGVSKGRISQIAAGKSKISAERAIEIEKATGSAVTCEDLLPGADWAYLRSTNPVTQTPATAAEASHA